MLDLWWHRGITLCVILVTVHLMHLPGTVNSCLVRNVRDVSWAVFHLNPSNKVSNLWSRIGRHQVPGFLFYYGILSTVRSYRGTHVLDVVWKLVSRLFQLEKYEVFMVRKVLSPSGKISLLHTFVCSFSISFALSAAVLIYYFVAHRIFQSFQASVIAENRWICHCPI